jgi:RNA polymerase sigma factor (sigma-70 family)
MTADTPSLLRFVRHVAAVQAGDATDADLLARFATARDEAAFAALVQRHGAMVLGVCRRVLNNTHDAEDAFQAAFLVLARRAGSAGGPRLLAQWLYGVAFRTALKARAQRAKRRVKERQVVPASAEDTCADSVWADLRPVLDEEIDRLPQKYRLPFVLCYLQGETNEEAARLIGCPKGTVLSRLASARERLRSRLTGRGVTLSAALLTTLVMANVAPAVPSLLATSTASAGVTFATGKGAAVVSQAIFQLAEGVLRDMLTTKLTNAAALALAVALTVVLAGGQVRQALAEKPDAPVVAERPVAFRAAQVSADDIIEVTGLNVYKFRLDIPKGEKFRVMLRELADKDAGARALHQFDFTREAEGPMTLRVSFLRRDGRLEGVLLDEAKQATYRVDCEGCSPPGIATIVQNPLAAVPPTEKVLSVIASDKAWGNSKSGPARLITVFHRNPGDNSGLIDAAFPRAELTVTRLPAKE